MLANPVVELNLKMDAQTSKLASDNDNEFENAGVGCALEMFTESEQVTQFIADLPQIYENERSIETALEKLTNTLNNYQEQPHLLDPYLNKLLDCAVATIRNDNFHIKLKNIAFKYVRLIVNIRGYKVVVRHMPHEVADVEPVLKMLENTDPNDKNDWESCYVLLLWMSIIVKIPFHMARLDGSNCGENTVMRRILNVCKLYLKSSETVAAAASYLTACFFTRADVVEECLKDFIDWSYIALEFHGERSVFQERDMVSSLSAIGAILKYGKRDDLLPFASSMLNKVLESNYKTSKNSLVRRYAVKVIQRIGLMFLKPKVAIWRYQRGSRSLAENLKSGSTVAKSKIEPELVEEEFDVPEEIEEVIEELMQGLKDSVTAIRWSAAKGIGRVTGRLPLELANEVAGSVLELLSPREGDGAWHGGCLALAELGRRGLLLPDRLPQVLPLLLQALIYEESRGYYSIGEHVRDAACYVAWSFARAYDPEVLKPHVNTIASGLLVVALFDREIKCRKAAAAAFQEHVGRQGTFPHGIDIVTAADYFSVAVRQNAYLNISVFVAGFPEYTEPLIAHLVSKKVGHWDAAVRELTSAALHKLTPLALDYVQSIVLPDLLVKTKSSDLYCRHGAILAVAEVIYALSLKNCQISPDPLNEIKSLLSYYRGKFYFNGMGGEITRQGFCLLIQRIAESKLPIHEELILADLHQLLAECLLHEVSALRHKAGTALTPFLKTFHTELPESLRDGLVDGFLKEVTSTNQTARFGFIVALSRLPNFILMPRLPEVVVGLLDALRITELTAKWAEVRRDCIGALVSVVNTAGVSALCGDAHQEWDSSVATNVGTKTRILPEPKPGPLLLYAVLEAFVISLGEYTQDARGDIGAWVREAAMSGLEKLILATANWSPRLLGRELLGKVMGGVAQQAVERINRTRALAGNVFCSLLHNEKPELINIPYYEELMKILPRGEALKEVVWGNESQTFPRFVQLLRFPCYTRSVMEGLIMSIGGLTESLVKHSSTSFFNYLKSIQDESERQRLCQVILDIFESHLHDARVIVPLLSFLDRLLGTGVVSDIVNVDEGHFPSELLRLAKLEVSKTKDFRKMVSNMDVFCQLVQVKGVISRRALGQLTVFLCNRLKAVRKAASSKLYESLLLYGDVSWVPEDNLEEAMTVLSDTDWEQEVTELRPIRNKLCQLMDVPVPMLMAKPLNTSAPQEQ